MRNVVHLSLISDVRSDKPNFIGEAMNNFYCSSASLETLVQKRFGISLEQFRNHKHTAGAIKYRLLRVLALVLKSMARVRDFRGIHYSWLVLNLKVTACTANLLLELYSEMTGCDSDSGGLDVLTSAKSSPDGLEERDGQIVALDEAFFQTASTFDVLTCSLLLRGDVLDEEAQDLRTESLSPEWRNALEAMATNAHNYGHMLEQLKRLPLSGAGVCLSSFEPESFLSRSWAGASGFTNDFWFADHAISFAGCAFTPTVAVPRPSIYSGTRTLTGFLTPAILARQKTNNLPENPGGRQRGLPPRRTKRKRK
jgi:hypothetical protein